MLGWLTGKPALCAIPGNANLCGQSVINDQAIQKALADIGADTDYAGHVPQQGCPFLHTLSAFHVTRIIVQVKAHPHIWVALFDIGGNVASAVHFHQIGRAGFLDLREIIHCTADIVAPEPLAAWPQAQKLVIVEGSIDHRAADAKTAASLACGNQIIHHARDCASIRCGKTFLCWQQNVDRRQRPDLAKRAG